jgi:hypothetical protein
MTTEHSHDKSTAMTMSPNHVDDDKPTEEAMQIYRKGMQQLRKDMKTMSKAELRKKGLAMLDEVTNRLR